ncbi:MAG: phosphoribosyltransferase [Candidatus Rokuibacteriota bacterium]
MSGELEKVYVTWTDVERMVGKLLRALHGHYDNILVITRGGMVPACLISERTGIRDILCAAVILYEDDERTLAEPAFVQFPDDRHVRGRRILVVDDVWDSGSTVVAVRERLRKAGAEVHVCVLHYKPGRSKFPGDGPDFYAAEADGWVVYPWDPAHPLPE